METVRTGRTDKAKELNQRGYALVITQMNHSIGLVKVEVETSGQLLGSIKERLTRFASGLNVGYKG